MRPRIRHLVPLALVLTTAPGSLQAQGAGQTAKARTTQEKISEALSAAPEAIAKTATVKDWPTDPTGDFTVLRRGTSEWVCLPTPPISQGFEPMCVDAEWQAFVTAFLRKQAPPAPKEVGYGYMLNTRGVGSNTDPFAAGQTADNQWHHYGGHLMLIFPDAKAYEGISDDPNNGGPYVMWKGTPYAHVMVPTTEVRH
jgi:hypothetical protein